ncbi:MULTISPECIES: glutaminyl-peptide cyclotransferase [Aequorivita]|uniref:Glutaminyl-peptide cyclotransferase n=1 Tax=Aequorivita iocasae TaxID=2803865 RepID=A0ABX7DV55_9FLAO|nr:MULTISPECIES: glutaminyl-peptide cyclotransferase [Aequorivita]QQX76639.1 glutaminyl-peptide cyclotransferase [Aequorivita iocasae]UCA56110.1 glutaminyl-peptide cyclotransferase [Aequorivita sp. F7]
MKIHNILVATLLGLLVGSCGSNSEEKKDIFSLKINNPKKTYTTEDVLSISLNNKKNIEIDSVLYFLNNDRIGISGDKISLSGKKLGEKTLKAQIFSDGEAYEASQKIMLLASIKPKLYTYKVIETYPHDIKAYTQGLEFENDTLYESTGQYKQSSLRKTDYTTGKVLKKVSLPDPYFGEGLTILNNKIYQLTWREKTGFIYNLETMEQTGTFVYGKSKEGWGLCHDAEKNIYKSDGTDRIWTLNSNTLAEKDYIEIFTNTSKINSVNELEWVEGKIYANVYQQGSIAIIDPSNGAVEGVIDLTDLKDKVTQHPELDVLNGIAYKGEPNILYITGKNWDKLFKIEILEK